jgi:hypothetical protein
MFLLHTRHVDWLHASLSGWGNGRRLYPNAPALAVVEAHNCAKVVAIAPIMTNPGNHPSRKVLFLWLLWTRRAKLAAFFKQL